MNKYAIKKNQQSLQTTNFRLSKSDAFNIILLLCWHCWVEQNDMNEILAEITYSSENRIREGGDTYIIATIRNSLENAVSVECIKLSKWLGRQNYSPLG